MTEIEEPEDDGEADAFPPWRDHCEVIPFELSKDPAWVRCRHRSRACRVSTRLRPPAGEGRNTFESRQSVKGGRASPDSLSMWIFGFPGWRKPTKIFIGYRKA